MTRTFKDYYSNIEKSYFRHENGKTVEYTPEQVAGFKFKPATTDFLLDGTTVVYNYFLNFWVYFLGLGAAMLYIQIQKFCYGDKDECFPQQETLQALCGGISNNSLRKYLDILEDYDFVHRFNCKNKATGKALNTVYKVRKEVPLLSEEMAAKLPPVLKEKHDAFIKEKLAKGLMFTLDDKASSQLKPPANFEGGETASTIPQPSANFEGGPVANFEGGPVANFEGVNNSNINNKSNLDNNKQSTAKKNGKKHLAARTADCLIEHRKPALPEVPGEIIQALQPLSKHLALDQTVITGFYKVIKAEKATPSQVNETVKRLVSMPDYQQQTVKNILGLFRRILQNLMTETLINSAVEEKRNENRAHYKVYHADYVKDYAEEGKQSGKTGEKIIQELLEQGYGKILDREEIKEIVHGVLTAPPTLEGGQHPTVINEDAAELWAAAVKAMAEEDQEGSLALLSCVQPVGIDDKRLILAVPNTFTRDRLTVKYQAVLEQILSNIYHETYEIDWRIT